MAPHSSSPAHTKLARGAVLAVARREHDFARWLVCVLADTADELGSTTALTARRPGSWEADLIQQLACRTADAEDALLLSHGEHVS
jgi:hypothetical protein